MANMHDLKVEGALVPVPERKQRGISGVQVHMKKHKKTRKTHGSLQLTKDMVTGKEASTTIGRVPMWRRLLFNQKLWLVILIFVVIMLMSLCALLLITNRKQDAVIQALIQAQMDIHKELTTTQSWNNALGKWTSLTLGLAKTVGLAAYLYVNPFGPIVLI